MKIICTQENLNRGLFVTSHIAGSNTNLPILKNILLKTENGLLKISSTNLEIGINCFVRGKIEKEGFIAVDAKVLSDYINLLPKDRIINLEVVDNILNITTDGYETKIKGNNGDDFPLIPVIENQNKITVPITDFKKSLQQTLFTVNAADSRTEISGLLIKLESDGKLKMVGTDGYRLAQKVISYKAETNPEQQIILPVKSLQELLRIIEDQEIEIGVVINSDQVGFVFDNIELVSKKIEGQYPDYKEIIPQVSATKSIVKVKDFVKAIKVASLFSRVNLYDINLEFLNNKDLIINSSNVVVGENKTVLEVEYKGADSKVSLNHRYLLDGLQNISSDNVLFNVTDNDTPCLLLPQDKDDYLYLVMPIKE